MQFILACLQLGPDTEGEEQLKEVTPRLNAWDDLQLPEGYRDILQSLIKSHFGKGKSGRMESDLVHHKGKLLIQHLVLILNDKSGKGTIILLHGVPGVGKASAAGMYS